MVSTFPSLLNPGSHPESQRMRVNIQSRPGKLAASSGVYISPVGRRLTKTVLTGRSLPIFARTTCFPRGVQKLPYSCPVPFFAEEMPYCLTIFSVSLYKSSVCADILISILICSRELAIRLCVAIRLLFLPCAVPQKTASIFAPPPPPEYLPSGACGGSAAVPQPG